jgi:RimJ/RimL family protein N-acetyltransferase/sirohydrochlorin ferrochelatase
MLEDRRMDTTRIVLAMHGTPPNDFPRQELGEFFRLHTQMDTSSRPANPALFACHAELEARVRSWPRTALNDPFHYASQELASHLQQVTGHPVLVGFNEFCAPSVEEALEDAVAAGATQVIVVTPMMTRGGEHAEVEIPAIIAQVQKRCPEVRFIYAWPFNGAEIARFLASQIDRCSNIAAAMASETEVDSLEISTTRLRLFPLDRENLRLSLEDPAQMEANLGLQVTGHGPEGEVRDAVQHMLEKVERDAPNWLWYTNWQIALRETNRIIGGFCFKGPANAEGEVEIGYGIEPEHQSQGFMTEALREIAHWAFAQRGVRAIIAETERSNAASHRVLEGVGFVLGRESDSALWWSITPQRASDLDRASHSARKAG